ncbi:MAG: ATP-binding cassette domain-containing protein, partial [Pseudomonadota bacterium]
MVPSFSGHGSWPLDTHVRSAFRRLLQHNLSAPVLALSLAVAGAPNAVAEGSLSVALLIVPFLPVLGGWLGAGLAPLGAQALVELACLLRTDPRMRQPLRRPGRTPVSHMRGFWGLISAYWTSERWVEAWLLTAAVIGITTLLSKASVWVAMASADFLNALVNLHTSVQKADPLGTLMLAAAVFAALALGRICGVALRHFCSTTLHRKARRWVQAQFSQAMLAERHIAANLVSDRAEGQGARLPDNIDQRVDECSMSVFGAVIGLAMGVWGSIASIYFVSQALIERSAPVPFLDRWAGQYRAFAEAHGLPAVDLAPGEYGSAVLVLFLIVTYVPLMTWVAWRLGRVLERQTLARQRADGSWRGELGQMLSRAPRLAISDGQRVQARVNGALYENVDGTWHRLNGTHSGFMAFTNSVNFLTNRLLGYLPALPAYLAGGMDFRTYAASSELVAELVNDTSWFIQVMPALATLKANTGRLTELACAVEAVQDNAEFYRETGRSAFRHIEHDPAFGLVLRDMALCHRGHDAEPFLTAPHLRLRPGAWAYLRGPNGAGKSCLLKAVMGLWPYGSGTVAMPAGARAFFAGQEPDLPERLSL